MPQAPESSVDPLDVMQRLLVSAAEIARGLVVEDQDARGELLEALALANLNLARLHEACA